MQTIHLDLKGKDKTSDVLCGEGVFEREFPRLVRSYAQSFILTDSNVKRLYGDKLSALAPDVPVYAMPAGEENKQPSTLVDILRAMVKEGMHRNGCLFAVGGGVVGDIGGLAAALYMRGISCVQVPTTLLAQVDSSVGGKTAVDLDDVKNVVGAFRQPEIVLADPMFFATLPPREIRCGLGEIVKHGALNAHIFGELWENRNRLTDLHFLSRIVPENIRHKADVVQQDEQETGLRKSLNLGHTTAHALELCEKKRSHGEYVLIGTIVEAELAKRHLECDGEYLDRLEELALLALGGMPKGLPAAEAAHFAQLDKKNKTNDTVVVTAPVRKGGYALLSLPYAEYEKELREICAQSGF